MKIQTMAGTRSTSVEPPRSTAYYYADLERLKKKTEENLLESSAPEAEYVKTKQVSNDGAVKEVPPLRDRLYSLPERIYHTPENSRKLEFNSENSRKFSPDLDFLEHARKFEFNLERKVPEYHTPENSRKFGETYSTAGTFPMPEPKEKEPLLAELEVIGRLPLTQLDPTIRRSRSWYLCCPNVEDEISRESSWRYSSLRPVTVPPVPGQNGINTMVTSQSSGREDIISLRTERDSLARALAAERQRSATAARAHDARLAELHGVIAELVRRRAHDKHARGIPEELSDDCESTTQPAGELDADVDRTEQNDTSSLSPEEPKVQPELPDDTSVTSHENDRTSIPRVTADACNTSLDLSVHRSDASNPNDRCCAVRSVSGDSCERQRGTPEPELYTHCAGRCSSRQAKLASRVRLKKTEHLPRSEPYSDEEWSSGSVEECAHADLRNAMTQRTQGECVWMRRALRLRDERDALKCAVTRATETAHRLYCACTVQESCSVALCASLRAADRAIETYDVLLALAETQHTHTQQRSEAELVACQLLCRLDAERASDNIGEPLLPSGPWAQHDSVSAAGAWSREAEVRLRGHCARLKADTVALRGCPRDVEEAGGCSAAEMESTTHDALSRSHTRNKTTSNRRKPRPRHWLDTPASETDL